MIQAVRRDEEGHVAEPVKGAGCCSSPGKPPVVHLVNFLVLVTPDGYLESGERDTDLSSLRS